MPPRYVYWTILIDGTATAFRAKEPDELLPTLNQLRRKNTDVTLRYFAHGKLWDSPEQADWARKNKGATPRDKRSAEWRPGGTHADPRARPRDKRAGAPGGFRSADRNRDVNRERDTGAPERSAGPKESRRDDARGQEFRGGSSREGSWKPKDRDERQAFKPKTFGRDSRRDERRPPPDRRPAPPSSFERDSTGRDRTREVERRDQREPLRDSRRDPRPAVDRSKEARGDFRRDDRDRDNRRDGSRREGQSSSREDSGRRDERRNNVGGGWPSRKPAYGRPPSDRKPTGDAHRPNWKNAGDRGGRPQGARGGDRAAEGEQRQRPQEDRRPWHRDSGPREHGQRPPAGEPRPWGRDQRPPQGDGRYGDRQQRPRGSGHYNDRDQRPREREQQARNSERAPRGREQQGRGTERPPRDRDQPARASERAPSDRGVQPRSHDRQTREGKGHYRNREQRPHGRDRQPERERQRPPERDQQRPRGGDDRFGEREARGGSNGSSGRRDQPRPVTPPVTPAKPPSDAPDE